MSKLDMLLRQVADEEDVLRSRGDTAERMASRFQRFAPGSSRRVWLWVPVAAAAAAAAAVLLLRPLLATPDLAVKIGSSARAPLVGAWLGAPDTAPLPLDFSDGSRFELKARARARVVGLERSSPRVELASGALFVHVVPGGPGTWHIDAGPFGVKVTGTRFLVSYEPESDRFEVSMEEGQVELTGCVFGKGRKLAVGQRVRASCRENKLEVSYRDLEPGAVGSASATPPAVTPESVEPARPLALEPSKGVRSAASTGKAAPAPWLALARGGKYREAYAAADQDGFESACQRSTAEELLLLADSARHARAPRQAKHALVLLRQRFGGGADAATAAFVLGRLEFDEFGAAGAAAEWFRTYLGERPSGPMAREALGRLIEAYERAGDSLRAADAARRYLRDYPTGPHAALASRLATTP